MNLDVNLPGMPALIAEKIRSDINNDCQAKNPPRHSWRVKPSDLGDDCVAKLWYAWRWVAKQTHDGRMARLFKRGHREEPVLVNYLRSTGWEVRDYSKRLCYHGDSDSYVALEWEEAIDPTLDDVSEDHFHIQTALKRDRWILKQYRIKSFGGHMSGYLDGICRHPLYSANLWVLGEFKTYNTKRFAALFNGDGKKKGGVRLTAPKYYGQICKYMKEYTLPWCLYVALNKNDDDIYIEVIPRDDAMADAIDRTAHTVITSRARPARIAESPAFHQCKQCHFAGICHGAEPVEINCRSCYHCVPIDGGKFACERWGTQEAPMAIPDEVAINAGCPSHTPVR